MRGGVERRRSNSVQLFDAQQLLPPMQGLILAQNEPDVRYDGF